MRSDGRERDRIRPVKITNNYLMSPQGSVLIEMGNTKVICTATVEEHDGPSPYRYRQRMDNGRILHASRDHAGPEKRETGERLTEEASRYKGS